MARRALFLSADDSLWSVGSGALLSSDTETLVVWDWHCDLRKWRSSAQTPTFWSPVSDQVGALLGVDGRATGESFAALWQDLDRERQARGWTRDRLARRTSQLSQQPYAEKTLHDRMAQGRRVPWDQVMWIVRALELDEQSWKQRWEQANTTRQRDRASPQPMTEPSTAPNHFGPTADSALTPTAPSSAKYMPAPSPFWRSRFASNVFSFVAGAVVTLMTVWAASMSWSTNDRSQPIACALVSSPTAEVSLTPDDSKPMFTKQRGDRITLPADTPATVATNGDRYRLVRTKRAPSGYAYMRDDALTSVPC